MAAATTNALSFKLLIDSTAQRVLFAEASKEVVDFLFSLLSLPVATAVKLVGKDAMVGCVGNLYGSVEKLESTYILPGAAKDALLQPKVVSPAVSSKSSLFRLPAPTPAASPKKFFRCNNGDGCRRCRGGYYSGNTYANCKNYVSDTLGTTCPSCGGQMNTEVEFALPADSAPPPVEAPTGGRNGFVQGIVTYTVMDNLTVTPMSTISSIALLNTFAVKNIGDLQEKTVQLGYNEGLAILKASLQSKTVLSDVFLGTKNASVRA